MILRGGDNVYCAEVESVIYEHPAVREAAVFALPDERLGEVVAAVVVLHEGRELGEDELTAFLSSRLAPYKVPTRLALTRRRLRTNAAGKVLKSTLAGDYFDTTA
jgi:long-chain acyl-CoA synthetase